MAVVQAINYPRSSSAGRDEPVTVSEYCPERPYLEIQVPDDVEVRRLIFTTVSHDQGSSNTQDHHGGTYEQSYTWFESAVVSPSGHERVPRRFIQNNVHASTEFRRHEIRWDIQDAHQKSHWDVSSPGMPVSTWLGAIRPGDVVQLIPKARYPAWLNYVKEAQMTIMGFTCSHQTPTTPSSISPTLVPADIYRPLNVSFRETRLIHLDPGDEDEISCTLTPISLIGDDVHYEALSYCWGDQADVTDVTIFVPSVSPESVLELRRHTVPVTSSLFCALKNLRNKDGSCCTLWIDAICINQNDLRERAEQIALMREIYSSAQNVIVCHSDCTRYH